MTIQKKFVLLLFMFLNLFFAGCDYLRKTDNVEYKIPSGTDITFAVTSDIHYLSEDLNDGGTAFQKYISSGDGKQLEYIDGILSAFVWEVKKTKPDILLISGDLTNNGEKGSHTALAKKLRDIESAGTSVYVIPGNHDVLNPWAREFKGDQQLVTDNVNSREFAGIYKDFGYGEAVARDQGTLSYLAAPSRDLWFLMLDTNQYKDNSRNGAPQTDGQISQSTFQWIKKCSALAKEKGAKLIAVMHHSLIDHSEVIQKGYTLNNNEQATAVLQNCGIEVVFSGHVHVQDISSYKKGEETIYDIASNALSVYPHQYGKVKYSPKTSGFDYGTARVDVEAWAKEAGIQNENLLHFQEYSDQAFGKLAYNMAYRRLLVEDIFTDSEIKSMSEIVRILNKRYFAGLENLNAEDVINTEGFQLWNASAGTFMKNYVMSIVKDKDMEDNELHITLQSKKP